MIEDGMLRMTLNGSFLFYRQVLGDCKPEEDVLHGAAGRLVGLDEGEFPWALLRQAGPSGHAQAVLRASSDHAVASCVWIAADGIVTAYGIVANGAAAVIRAQAVLNSKDADEIV